jgi:hypothetical protein
MAALLRDPCITLLIIPCSGGKEGCDDPNLPVRSVEDYLDADFDADSVRALRAGREMAFARTFRDDASPLRPAIAWYTGQPYSTPGFREGLIRLLRQGLHCLVISGGYGVLRPEELIHCYKAHISQTRSIWNRRIPKILMAYIRRNGIVRTIGCYSSQYGSVVPDALSGEDWRCVPTLEPHCDRGTAIQVVPRKVGKALASLLGSEIMPGDTCWVRK